VWRQDLRVYWKRIDSLEAEALGKLEQGLPFVELCEWLTRRNTSEDATRAALGLLEAWVEDQLLVAPPAR
jgi:hypothetical protein